MDPNETVRAILVAVADDDAHAVGDRAAELQAWMDRGGFPPTLGAVEGVRIEERNRQTRAFLALITLWMLS